MRKRGINVSLPLKVGKLKAKTMRVIDSREPAEVKRLFLKEGFEEQSLSSGDFRFSAFGEKIVGIERKDDDDLIASLRVDKPDGSCRLERELWRLKAEVDYNIQSKVLD